MKTIETKYKELSINCTEELGCKCRYTENSTIKVYPNNKFKLICSHPCRAQKEEYTGCCYFCGKFIRECDNRRNQGMQTLMKVLVYIKEHEKD